MTTDTEFSAVLSHEPADEYHSRAGEFLSSHLLADFRKCPQLYHRKRQGLIDDGDRPAYLLGRAAHTVILEGDDAFHRQFAVGGPINPKTGLPYGASTKAWAEWAEAQDKDVLTHDQHALVQHLAASVRAHAAARELLAHGVAEGVLRADYGGRPCQIRLDWFTGHEIVDLKTVDVLDYFEVDARRYGYVHQLAFYRAVLAQRIGVRVPCYFLAVEKKEPFRCGVWRVSAEALQAAERENEAAIARLTRCEAEGHWPTLYEEPRLFDYV